MTKRRTDSDRKADRHAKKAIQLRLHPQLRAALEALVSRNASTLTSELTIALREKLEREKLWPPAWQQIPLANDAKNH